MSALGYVNPTQPNLSPTRTASESPNEPLSPEKGVVAIRDRTGEPPLRAMVTSTLSFYRVKCAFDSE
ncbi:hypothetical protein JTE90_001802 [Oedothorax gibbosus]|uniref:Uncharacterized protein n=1 Tax=Oedothorax gibbosus TaxID=931172 RepID=A0AAV6VQR1_9ARAC|nr:hypothetical protein JTE90_001802 [Oedothorax gibbosus]